MGKQGIGYEDDESFVKASDSCLGNALKFSFKGGAVGAAMGVFVAQHQVGLLGFAEIVGQAATRFVLPGALGGAVFASTTCIMDNTRGKDSPISNAFIGGLAAGVVVGAKSHKPWVGLQLGLLFGTAGAVLRCFAVGAIMRENPQADLDHLNQTLYMSDIKHLAPKQE
jgi:hypothetical protein